MPSRLFWVPIAMLALPAIADRAVAQANPEASQANAQLPAVAAMPAAERERARNYFSDRPVLTQAGEVRRFYSDVLDDRVVLINFIYTDCKDACPLITQRLKQVQAALGEQFGAPVFFVTISVDPERDTPAVLSEFARQQKAEHPAWLFLTGDKADVDHIVSKLGQYSPEVGNHSTLLIAGNTRTGQWSKIPPTATATQIALKLESLAGQL